MVEYINNIMNLINPNYNYYDTTILFSPNRRQITLKLKQLPRPVGDTRKYYRIYFRLER